MYKLRAVFILRTKITAAQNNVALSYHRVRGLYFPVVVFPATVDNVRDINNSFVTA